MKKVENTNFSKIGLGTARFGTDRLPEQLAFEMMDVFVENGGTILDTARNYYEWEVNGRGKSEKCIGKWLSHRKRENICICTKGGLKGKGEEASINLSKTNLLTELKESLFHLNTDYLDIYLLHKDEPERKVEEIVESMQIIKEEGKIGKIGVANWSLKRIIEANNYAVKNKLEPFTVLQTWWSLAEYKKEMWNDKSVTYLGKSAYQYCKENKMICMGYTSQCKGYFQKAIEKGLDNVDPFLRHRIETERNLNKLNYIKGYCSTNNCSATDVVIGYITSNPLPGIALVSCSSVSQLEDILKSSDYILPEKNINELDKI